MYQALPLLDAVVIAAGSAHFAPLTTMTAALYRVGIHSKLLGQVHEQYIYPK